MRGGLVQEHEAGVAEEQPRKRDPLDLAGGEPLPSFPDRRVQARGEAAVNSSTQARRAASWISESLAPRRPS